MIEPELQLSAIQEQLKRLAQELGQLNMVNNQFLQENQELSIQIKNLQNKIVKKKLKIQQENKDKSIIHQKLVKAEKVKEQLEIKHTQIQAHKEEQQLKQQRLREIEENKKRVERNKRNQLQLQKISQTKALALQQQLKKTKKIQQNAKATTEKVEIKIQMSENPVKKEIIPQKQRSVKPQNQQKKGASFSTFYANTQKGDYQPPALFLDDDEQDSEQDEDTLQKLRQKLKQQKLNMAEEDDD